MAYVMYVRCNVFKYFRVVSVLIVKFKLTQTLGVCISDTW